MWLEESEDRRLFFRSFITVCVGGVFKRLWSLWKYCGHISEVSPFIISEQFVIFQQIFYNTFQVTTTDSSAKDISRWFNKLSDLSGCQMSVPPRSHVLNTELNTTQGLWGQGALKLLLKCCFLLNCFIILKEMTPITSVLCDMDKILLISTRLTWQARQLLGYS